MEHFQGVRANRTRVEELLHDLALGGGQALVQVANAVGESLSQGRVVDLLKERRQVLLGAVQEPEEGWDRYATLI